VQSTIQKDDDGISLLLEDRFTFNDHEAFRQVMDSVVKAAPSRLTIDLSKAVYLDSAAVGMLLMLRERLDRISIVLKGGNQTVKELIRIAKLGTLFDLAD
jgi:anti-anti-sigma factor